MNSSNPDPIKAISNAISIVDDYSFNVFDQRFHVAYQQPYQRWDQPMELFGGNPGEEDQLISNLTSQLYAVIYSAFYVKGTVKASNLKDWEHQNTLAKPGVEKSFIDELSNHNLTEEGLDKMWRIYAVDPQGNAFVEKNGDVRQLQANTYEFANASETQVNVNSFVHIKQPKEHRELQPTFYHVNSQELMPLGEEFGRFYWNIEADGAKLLIEQITKVFNEYRVPFMFKCNNHPDLYNRSDGAVLYILRKQYRIVTRLLKLIVPKVKPFLKQEIPLFSRRITNGLSYAEDPGNNQSFGMSRSQIIARGIVKAYKLRKNSQNAQYQEIILAFRKSGLDIKHPYLRANSHLIYDFDFLD